MSSLNYLTTLLGIKKNSACDVENFRKQHQQFMLNNVLSVIVRNGFRKYISNSKLSIQRNS